MYNALINLLQGKPMVAPLDILIAAELILITILFKTVVIRIRKQPSDILPSLANSAQGLENGPQGEGDGKREEEALTANQYVPH